MPNNSVAIRVKANANYICQECGSTELIQAHHEIPGDDDSLIALCADCHSKKHPDVPKALFLSTNNQPYWHNKSASSIAKVLSVHPRTIIRAARRLQILPGLLSNIDKRRLIDRIITRKANSETPTTQRKYQPLKKWQATVYQHKCSRCGLTWESLSRHPLRCGKCKSPYWDKERIKQNLPDLP